MWAIYDALKVSIKKTDNINATPIIVFTDSKVALIKIPKKGAKSAVKSFLY